MIDAGPRAGRRLPRSLVSLPLLLGALCLLGVLPLVIYTPDAPASPFVMGKAIGIVALVAYPILLAGHMILALWMREHGMLSGYLRPFRWAYWALPVALFVALGTAGYLMTAP